MFFCPFSVATDMKKKARFRCAKLKQVSHLLDLAGSAEADTLFRGCTG